MQIRIRYGKGSKERYAILSQTNLELLCVYFKRYRPQIFLFENDRTHKPLTGLLSITLAHHALSEIF